MNIIELQSPSALFVKRTLPCYFGRLYPIIMKQFIHSRLCYRTETNYCLFLLQIARMEEDCILKNLAYIFQILACHLEALAKNVLWMTFPANFSSFQRIFVGMSSGQQVAFLRSFGRKTCSKTPMTEPLKVVHGYSEL